MLNGVFETASSELASITRAIPETREKWVPFWNVRLVVDWYRLPSIVILNEIGAVPTILGIEFVLVGE